MCTRLGIELRGVYLSRMGAMCLGKAASPPPLGGWQDRSLALCVCVRARAISRACNTLWWPTSFIGCAGTHTSTRHVTPTISSPPTSAPKIMSARGALTCTCCMPGVLHSILCVCAVGCLQLSPVVLGYHEQELLHESLFRFPIGAQLPQVGEGPRRRSRSHRNSRPRLHSPFFVRRPKDFRGYRVALEEFPLTLSLALILFCGSQFLCA